MYALITSTQIVYDCGRHRSHDGDGIFRHFFLVRVRVVPMTMTSFAVLLIFLLVRGVVVPKTMAFLSMTLVVLVGRAVVAPTMMIAVVVPSLPSPLSLAAATSFVPLGAVLTAAVVLVTVLLLAPTIAVRGAIDAARSAPPPWGGASLLPLHLPSLSAPSRLLRP
jgi:hypothetical protein